MQRLSVKHRYFMGGFLAGFGFYTAVFFLGYFWRLRALLG